MDMPKNSRRRDFMAAAGIAASGAVGAALLPRSEPADRAVAAPPGGGSRYRASPHILKYYQTAQT
jgi:hypothetical protein